MTARPPERDDLDSLLDPLLTFAQDMLRKHGEFYPFAASMSTEGQIRLVAGYEGSEHPPSQEVIDLLTNGLAAQASTGQIRAAGICYDVRIRTPDGSLTDAIAASLEHRAGDAVLVFMPYSKGRFSGVRFGELTSSQGERKLFRDPSS